MVEIVGQCESPSQANSRENARKEAKQRRGPAGLTKVCQEWHKESGQRWATPLHGAPGSAQTYITVTSPT